MNNFESLGLRPEILNAVAALGFTEPTPIQAQAIPTLIDSTRDLVGFAATGTGKTAAFSLPIIQNIDSEKRAIQSIILCPTRELCLQITNDIKDFTKFLPSITTVAVYGGDSIDRQLKALKRGVQIVVGTPGRVCDMLRRGALDISEVRWVVLDEADEMLSMGFKDDMDFILDYTPSERQTVMFSATMPREIEHIAKKYMRNPERITIERKTGAQSTISHEYYVVKGRDKYETLRRIADLNPDIYAIVFCRTRQDTKEVAARFSEDGYNADALHGDLSQAQRDFVMQRFRNKQLQILIATDVAARGIDVDNLSHVINFEMPENAEVYTHRTGRTGRAGNKGMAVSILNAKEVRKILDFERRVGGKFERKMVPTGQDVCQAQLMHLINKTEKVEINPGLETYMEAIYKKLENVSKEEIIKKFVSLEFNRFLVDYKNSDDLNSNGRDDRRDDRKDSGREERKGRERRDDRERGERGERGERTEREDRKKGRRSEDGGFSRIFINLGYDHKINPPRLIDLINMVPAARKAAIGKIDIQDGYSSIDIEEAYGEILLDQFHPKTISGVWVTLSKTAPSGSEGGGKTKSRSYGGDRENNFKNSGKKPYSDEKKPRTFNKKRNVKS